jgi:thiopurine S-methyltransferase
MQQEYVKHLKTLFRSHTRFFLVTVEFPKAQLSGPPFSITATDVQSLFSGFTIECLATNKLKDKQFAQRSLEVDYLSEKLYIITKK